MIIIVFSVLAIVGLCFTGLCIVMLIDTIQTAKKLAWPGAYMFTAMFSLMTLLMGTLTALCVWILLGGQ